MNSYSSLEKEKQNRRYHNPRFQTILQSYISNPYSTDTETYTQINGIELRTQKYTHNYIVNQSITKEERKYYRKKTVFPINAAGKVGQLRAKERNWTTFLYCIPNEFETKI